MMTAATRTGQANIYKMAGDIVNVFNLAASIAFVSTVVYFAQPGSQGVIDQHYKKDGFCIQNADVPYWSSFDTCLYVDVGFSAILTIMYIAWRDIQGMEASSARVPGIIAATVGHGFAHAAMAVKLREGTYHQREDHAEQALSKTLMFCAVFWFPLIKAAMCQAKNHYVAILAAIFTYGQRFVEKEYGMAYVQTVVNVAFHGSLLMQSPVEKNQREYLTFSMTNVLPIVIAWNEALFCDSYVRSAGGHVLYDGSIIISSIVYYLDCYCFSAKSSSKSSTKEKTT